jgi:CheY-like chemotaxis protein
MQNIFLTLGCTVQSAQNGEEALDLVKQGFVPEIVCMDIIMPGMNGVEATQELKSLGLQAYFIAVSAFKDHSDDVVSPFDAWLPKPFTMEHIIGVLAGYEHNNILNRRQNSITVSLSDISAHTKQVLADYAREGAYTALENELSLLPESPSKDILLNLLKKMDLDAMIETIVSS